MSYKFSCFISYPHGQKNVLVPFINKFVKGLEDEIFLQSDKGVFVDSYLEGGDRLDEEIGPNLCQSACMILFFTPLYFTLDHVYCARELLAMQKLEEQRRNFLPDKGKGLIIPIILRGEKKFPEALKNTLYYNFTDIVDPAKMLKIKSETIRKIAQYILDRCDDLDKISENDIPRNCETYCLPDSEEAKKYVEKVLEKKIDIVPGPFPIRTEDRPTIKGQNGG